MIVRIMGEGQRRLGDGELGALNSLDSVLEDAIEAGNEDAFRVALHDLLDRVRGSGSPLSADELEPSDLVLPPADATMDEVASMLSDEGLIPD